MSMSKPPDRRRIDCSGLSPETVEAMKSAVTFIREKTEQQDQGPQAFAELEIGLMDRMLAVQRSMLRDCVEVRKRPKQEDPS